MNVNNITVEEIRKLFNYDKDTGIISWANKKSSRVLIGNEAGYKRLSGYRQILINRKAYQSHRVAWAIIYGEWPNCQIDHINGIADDNRILNLREATPSENRQNIGKVVSKSGVIGVTWHKQSKRWQSSIKLNGRSYYLGLFETIESASKAYKKAKTELHKFQPIVRDAA